MKDFFLTQFQNYKKLGDKIFEKINDAEVLCQYNSEGNTISSIVIFFSGNMILRWSHCLENNAQKEARNIAECENAIPSKLVLLKYWEKGWSIFFEVLNRIPEDDLKDVLSMHGEKNSLIETFLRELEIHSYHLGQIVYVAKMVKNKDDKNRFIAENKLKVEKTEHLKKQNFSEINQNSSPVCFAKSEEVRDDYKID